MRIGAFSIECGEVIASDRLYNLKEPSHDDKKEGCPTSALAISNVKNGPWIAGRCFDINLGLPKLCNSLRKSLSIRLFALVRYFLLLHKRLSTKLLTIPSDLHLLRCSICSDRTCQGNDIPRTSGALEKIL